MEYMISYEDIIKIASDGELAGISMDFWLTHKNPPRLKEVSPDSQVWAELRAFQLGWLRCKEYYGIKNE